MNDLAALVKKVFSEKFKGDPFLYFSPGRINLIGEHVDYNDGFVMPAAINKGLYYAIRPNKGNTVNFYSLDFDEDYSTPVDDVHKEASWKNYVLSVLNEFLLAGHKIGGFDCVLGGDIPGGSGMSSSAAVEGGLAFALNEIFNVGYDRKELALLCQRAEHNFPGVKCGIMDQYANMFGKKDQVILLDCKSVEHTYLPLQLKEYEIVLVNSKVHHSLASSEYNQRRLQCEEGLAVMKAREGITSFRQVAGAKAIEKYESLVPDAVYACCSYVVEEIARTQKAAKYLQQQDLVSFGKLMYETHWGLSKKYKVSCSELDFLVSLAEDDAAVIGSRLMGGGFGGCTINLVRSQGAANFARDITNAYEKETGIGPEIYFVQTADGTQRLAQ
jgi:galactokinase